MNYDEVAHRPPLLTALIVGVSAARQPGEEYPTVSPDSDVIELEAPIVVAAR